MAVDGITATYCKPEGRPHFRIIQFIVAPCAQEVVMSYKDQVRLNILQKSYLCYLGPHSGTPKYSELIYVPQYPENEVDKEGYDPHVQIARHIVASII